MANTAERKDARVYAHETEDGAAREGRSDGYCREVGGFVVARMSDGTFEYFAHGTPPHRGGEVDRDAEIVSRHAFRGRAWRTV